ncbi:MAG: transglycosylase domain-containing protein [Dermatophilaceae bacterium]
MSERTARPKGRTTARTWVRRIVLVLLGLVGLAFVSMAVAFALVQVPSPNDLAEAQTTVLYYDDGRTEMARVAELNRESVPLSAVPVHVRNAVIAAEDRDFSSNQGISVGGIARSVWQALRGSDVQGGGSTITQQYVKNYFLTQDRTADRKVREMIIAVKIDKDRTKDEILEGYLNTIYYGRGAYGIQTAARAYFNKDVGQLTVAEGAVLASIINAPSLYDPALGDKQKANLQARFDYVLDGMAEQGWLSAQERSTTTMPVIQPKAPSRALSGPSGYVVSAVRDELKTKLNLSDQDIDQGGLRITTTISKSSQDAAVKAMDDNVPTKGADNLYAGLVAVRPGDGAVVAMYGGKDYQSRQFSSATDAQIPAGSTFKPFALVAALQQGISTKSTVDGDSPLVDAKVLGAGTTISNEGGRSYGTVDLRRATASSINTAFMRLNMKITPKATYDAAVASGIPQDTAGLGQEYTNVLGTASPKVIDVAGAYATIAAQGQRGTPYLIKSVNGSLVGVDYTATPNVQQAFSKDVAADVIDAMQQVTKSGGTAARAAQVGRPVAGKTGTSEDRKSVWFSGYTPQLATSVAMFQDVNGVMQPLTGIGGLDELSGNSFPLSIWIDFMRAALKGQPEQDFPDRVGIGDEKVRASSTPERTSTPAPTTRSTPAPVPTQSPDATGQTQPTEQPTSQGGSATRTTRPTQTRNAPATQQAVPTGIP